jgi:hypothetical protein
MSTMVHSKCPNNISTVIAQMTKEPSSLEQGTQEPAGIETVLLLLPWAYEGESLQDKARGPYYSTVIEHFNPNTETLCSILRKFIAYLS